MSGVLGGEPAFAEGGDAEVDEGADVSDAGFQHLGDLLVGEAGDELQADGVALGQGCESWPPDWLTDRVSSAHAP